MSQAPFRVELLDANHVRTNFNSGVAPLDEYFHRQVTQDVRRRITACFVAIDERKNIAAFYTLASSSVLLSDLPAPVAKKLPRYPSIPAVRMGRLAVDQRFKGKGLGAAMLADALGRAAAAQIAAYAMFVDAKDDSAAGFYRHHGFIELSSNALGLFLPLSTVKNMV